MIEKSTDEAPELDQDDEEFLDELLGSGDDEGEGPPQDDGQPADEATADDSDDEAPADSDADVEEPQPDDGSAPQGAPEGQAPSGSDVPEDDDELVPFAPKADGVHLEVQGAFRTKTHTVIPNEEWDRRIQPNLANRRVLGEREKGYQKEIQSLKTVRSAKEARAEAIVSKLDTLLDDPREFAAFMQDFSTQAPLLRKDAELAALRAEADQRRSVDTEREAEEHQAALEPRIQTGVRNWVNSIAARPEFNGLRLDVDGIYTDVMALRDQAITIADEDDEEAGIKKGQPAVNVQLIYRMAQREAAALRRAQGTTKGAVAAAKHNAAATAQPRRAPATVGAKGSATPTKLREKPKSRQEWEANLMADDD